MTVRFARQELADLYTGEVRGKPRFSKEVLKQYRKTVNRLSAAVNLANLRQIKSLNLHDLKDDLAGKHAVRVNMQYRIVFTLTSEHQIEIIEIEDLVDYH